MWVSKATKTRHGFYKPVTSDAAWRKRARDEQADDGLAFVYFVQCGDAADGPVKIGIATDMIARLKVMQSGCPYPLRLIGFIRHEDPGTVERQLHRELAEHHIRGEWFRWCAYIKGAVAELNEHAVT